MKFQFRSNLSISLILLAILLTHIMLVYNDFHTDDWQILMLMEDGFDWLDFISMENLSNFRPFTNIVLFLRSLVFGNNPALWYLLNIALHLVVTWLVYHFVKTRFNQTAALASALFFGIYFQHYEGVVWIYGIVRLLAALNMILSIRYFFNYLDNDNKRDLYLSYLLFGLGLFTVEDILVFSVFFMLSPFILKERFEIKKAAVMSIGYWALPILYLTLRFAAIGWADPSTEYYFVGKHALVNFYSFLVWIIIPDLSHSYLLPHIAANASFLVPYISTINIIAFMVVILVAAGILLKGNRIEKASIFFILISFILPSFYDFKISTKLLYVPSLAIAIIFGSLYHRLYGRLAKSGKTIMIVAFALYLIVQAIAINITIHAYRQNHEQVRQIADKIVAMEIEWDNFDNLVLENVPGRARPGHLLKYRIGFDIKLILQNEHSDGLVSVDEGFHEIHDTQSTFIHIDYNSGNPLILQNRPEIYNSMDDLYR